MNFDAILKTMVDNETDVARRGGEHFVTPFMSSNERLMTSNSTQAMQIDVRVSSACQRTEFFVGLFWFAAQWISGANGAEEHSSISPIDCSPQDDTRERVFYLFVFQTPFWGSNLADFERTETPAVTDLSVLPWLQTNTNPKLDSWATWVFMDSPSVSQSLS